MQHPPSSTLAALENLRNIMDRRIQQSDEYRIMTALDRFLSSEKIRHGQAMLRSESHAQDLEADPSPVETEIAERFSTQSQLIQMIADCSKATEPAMKPSWWKRRVGL